MPGTENPGSAEPAWTAEEEDSDAEEIAAADMVAVMGRLGSCDVKINPSGTRAESDDSEESTDDEGGDGGVPRRAVHGEYQFRSTDAWDRRFTRQAAEPGGTADPQQAYDEWYISYESSAEMRSYMKKRIRPHSLVLQIGCGNSKLAEHLHGAGYRHICNIDLSQPLVQLMRRKYGLSHPQLVFGCGDALALDDVFGWHGSPQSSKFDVVIDKGTLQSILLLRGGVEKAGDFAEQVWNRLRLGGRFIVILGAGRGMEQYLKGRGLNWQISFRAINEGTKRTGVNRTINIFTFVKPRGR